MVWGSEARRPLRQRPVVQPARGRSPSPSGRLAEPAPKPRRAPSWEARSLLGRGQQPFSVKGRIVKIFDFVGHRAFGQLLKSAIVAQGNHTFTFKTAWWGSSLSPYLCMCLSN